MKTSCLFKSVFVLLFFLVYQSVYLQDLNVQKTIGKTMDYVISKYGKPAHQDVSNKSMQCVFYKSKTSQSVFVADQDGVYQAESSMCYDKQSSAKNALLDLVNSCKTSGYQVDTVNTSEYNLYAGGVKLNASLFENNLSNKYEVKVKANRGVGLK